MTPITRLFCAGLLVALSPGLSAFDLVKDGQSQLKIVVAADAIPAERTAAAELQNAITQISGAKLPIVVTAGSDPAIYIGQSPEIRKMLPGIAFGNLKPDEILLRTVGRSLVLSGARPRGSLYATYELLETYLGVRFWAGDVTEVPSRKSIVLPELNIRYAPPFAVRDSFCDAFNYDGIFSARRRINGQVQPIPAEYGGREAIWGLCHTFHQLLPGSRYFAAHPDWYALRDGVRRDGQLCLSNPEALDALVREAGKALKESGLKVIAIGQNDNELFCQCPNCAAFVAREGTQSALMLDFVNRCAEKLEKEFPGVQVDTLAYQYTRTPPPRIRPRSNVTVRLCSIESDFSKGLDSSGNADFRDNLRQWHAIAPKLAVWNYVANYGNYLIPHPNWRHLASDLRFMAANGVTGVFEQGVFGAKDAVELAPLRAWLLSRLLWNPALDQNRLIDEFLAGYYGAAAAPYLREYLELTQREVEAAGALPCFLKDTSSWLSIKTLLQADALFAKAEKAVKDDPVKFERVKRAGLAVRCAMLLHDDLEAHGISPVDVYNEYLTVTKPMEVRSYSEVVNFNAFIEGRGQQLKIPSLSRGPAPDFCRALKPENWLEFQAYKGVTGVGAQFIDIVEDRASTSGKVARMPDNHVTWALQMSFLPPGRYDVYVGMRCDPKAKGQVLEVGVFKPKRWPYPGKPISAVDCAGIEYRYILVEENVVVDKDTALYAAPYVNPQGGYVYVDRFILVRKE